MPTVEEILPHFEGATEVTGATARQDRVYLRYGDWSKTGTEASLSDLMSYISRATVGDYDGTEIVATGSPTGRLMDRVPILTGGRGRVATQPALLFSGSVHVSSTRNAAGPQQSDVHTKWIHANISLNPTRFTQHQGPVRRRGQDPRRWRYGTPRLVNARNETAGPDDPLSEWILVPEQDNVVVGSPQHLIHLTQGVWPHHLARYWHGVQDVLQQIVDSHPGPTHFSPLVTLYEVETYWEFYDPCPVAKVTSIEHQIRSRYPDIATTYQPIADREFSWNGPYR